MFRTHQTNSIRTWLFKNNSFKNFSLTLTPFWEMANITDEENCSAPTDHGDFFSRTFENRQDFWALIFAIAE